MLIIQSIVILKYVIIKILAVQFVKGDSIDATQKYNKPIEWDDEKAKAFLGEIRIRKMLSLVGTGKKILDVGCFTGDISKAIQAKGNEVHGADCNTHFVEMTGRKGITAWSMDLEDKFPFDNESFDVIFAGEIIEHIYKTENFLRECYRILKQNGEIIISTPNINWLSFRWQMLWGKTLPFGITSGNEEDFRGHIRYYTVESLKQTLENFGFQVEIIKGSNITNKKGLQLTWLADKWPSISYHIIMKARKV